MLKFLSVIVFAVVTVSPTFAMTKHMPQRHGLLPMPQQHGLLPNVNHTVKAPDFTHTKRPEFLDRTHAPQAATQPMQPSRGMFNNPNEFRAPLIVVLTEMKRLGGDGLPVPNLGRFVGGGNTKIDNQITPDQLADKLFQLDRTHAPQAATQPMQPSRGMFNNPNEFRAPLIVVLTEMKRLGGDGLPVPNLGRFVGGGNTKIDNQITPDQLADKLFQIEPKAGNKCMLSIHQNDRYWDALLNDLRGGRGQNPAYMAEIQKLRELQSKLVVFK